jgi:hypothetical protein
MLKLNNKVCFAKKFEIFEMYRLVFFSYFLFNLICKMTFLF